jgi:hypothetical protein
MIMDTLGRRKYLGGSKHSMVLGEARVEIWMDRGCIDYLNGMRLGKL